MNTISPRIGLLLAIGVASCRPAPVRDVPTSRSQELAQEEAPYLEAAQAGARRSGDTLLLQLAGGDFLPLVDDTTEGDRWVRYVFRGQLPRTHFLVVDVGFYEGGMYLLVDPTTGHKTFVDAQPEPSPSGRFLAVPSMDMEAEYEPTRLTIYAVDADSLRQLWRLDSIPWGPDSVAWHGDDSLLVSQAYPTDSGPGSYSYRTAWVLRTGADWHLEEQRP